MSPVMKRAQDNAITEAKEKAKEEAMARLIIEQEALDGNYSNSKIHVQYTTV